MAPNEDAHIDLGHATLSHPWMRSGMQIWACRKGSKARLLWVTVEQSLDRPGWLCRLDQSPLTVHSDELENIEQA